MYYRLYDKQTQRYMATGYNAKSEEELIEAYISYKSADTGDDTLALWKNATAKEMMNTIGDDEFEVETSEKPFEEEDYN